MNEDFQRKYALLREAIVLALVELEPLGRSDKEAITRAKKILEISLDGSGAEGLEASRIIAEQFRELNKTTTEFDHRPSTTPMTEQERDSADMVWDYPDKKERE